tara:strand:- start:285 stop:1220 length:936 start_codon:yes stop_codon:yes gene_type:complete
MNLNPPNNKYLYGYKSFFLNFVNMYNNNLLPNKIIFSGNKGIGKSTFVYHLINYIFSINENDKYNINENTILDNNQSYKLITKNSHPNFFLISNDDDKNNIQISKIREMINFTNKSSFNNEPKIILIDNVEYLNINSINALLKAIEEPNNNLYFFLIHNSKIKILDTLNSRCIKFNFFLDSSKKDEIIKKLLDDNFYNNLNNDYRNIYNSPGDLFLLFDFFTNNEIDPSISITDLLELIISKKLFKKDIFIKNNLTFFIELYFNKKINIFNSKDEVYSLYKYFLSKISDCNKYNLDIENVLIEFNGKIING